jgi:hypothetical protein
MPSEPGVALQRTPDRADDVDALAAESGGRVGLAGVLADLDRQARIALVPGRSAPWGFRWDGRDQLTGRWWPQGIDVGRVGAREVVLTTAYAKPRRTVQQGCRLTVADVTDPDWVRYRHVLLVEAVADRHGAAVAVRPVRAHAGGLAWHGQHLYVARTLRGLCCFRLDDIVAVPAGRSGAFGYRYLLPVRLEWRAYTSPGTGPFRYSFVSAVRGARAPGLLAGEYGHGQMSTRLVRYDLHASTSLLRADRYGAAHPTMLQDAGVARMQGAVLVDGRYYLSTSAGRFSLGSLWVGEPGAFRRHRGALPAGPEDLSHSPDTDRLWSVSEHRFRRYVFALDRARF